MIKESLYAPYEISFTTVDKCGKDGHKHSFFELVFIGSGTGTQCINDNTFSYKEHHMFVLTAEDCHSFKLPTAAGLFF